MSLFILLPIIFFTLTYVLFYHYTADAGSTTRYRMAIVYATLGTTIFIYVITEALSAFSKLQFTWLLAAWLAGVIPLLTYTLKKRILVVSLKDSFSYLYKQVAASAMLKTIAIFSVLSLIASLMYPPNNYDSMTYHLARVAHWEQNQSISHYQTHILRQLICQPLGEWMLLHIKILTASDRFVNALQLVFFAFCLVCVSLITKEFGGNSKQQKLSALLVCLTPAILVETNTTQNDIVVAFFALAFIYFTIRLVKNISLSLVIAAGLSLGFAWLTKGTAYLYSMLFCGWFVLIILKNYKLPFGRLLKMVFMAALVPVMALLINASFFYRNTVLTGSALGNLNEVTGNKGHDAKSLAFVAIKNFLNHMPVNKPVKNYVTEKATSWGVDINDLNYSFNTLDWLMEGFSFHEDYAQNFVATLLIIFIIPVFLLRRKHHKGRSYYELFFFTLLALGVLFCITLKWQPWSNRLQATIFMLWSVVLAIELSEMPKWFRYACVGSMFVFAFAAIMLSNNHRFLPPARSAFMKPYDSFIYKDGLPALKKYLDTKPYSKFGIYLGEDAWDYPYYRLLGGKGRTLEHVLVTNQSQIYSKDFDPDAIINMGGGGNSCVVGNSTYYRTATFTDGTVLYEKTKPANFQ